MKLVLTALFAFPFGCFAQELKLVSKEYQNPYYKEEYSVLKSDKKVKEGKYVKSAGNAIIQTGFYKNNLKDSSWVSYSKLKKVESKGNFKNGLRVGVWEFYDQNGELQSSYDYTNGKLISYQLKEGNSYKGLVKTENGFIEKSLDRPIISFPSKEETNGDARIKYPQEAMRQGITAIVNVSWVVDEQGNVSDPIIEEKKGYGFDEEAIRVGKYLQKQIWLPALINGQPVATKYTLPLKFGVQ